MNNIVFPQTYHPRSLAAIVTKQPYVSFSSTCFCAIAAYVLLSSFWRSTKQTLLQAGEDSYAESLFLGILFTILIVWMIFLTIRWLMRSFDRLILGMLALHFSVYLVVNSLRGDSNFIETVNISDVAHPYFLSIQEILSTLSVLIHLPAQGYFKEFLLVGAGFLLLRYALLYIYGLFSTMIELMLLYSSPRWLINLIQCFRYVRVNFLRGMERRNALAYSRYFFEYFVSIRDGETLFEPSVDEEERDTDYSTTSTEHRIVRCQACGTLNRIPLLTKHRQYRCASCGASLSGAYHGNTSKKDPDENRDSFETYCRILGIPPTNDIEEIRKAYKQMMKKYHPDGFAGFGKEFERLAHERTVQITNAYQRLLDLLKTSYVTAEIQ